MKNKGGWLLIVAGIVVFVVLISVILFAGRIKTTETPKIGFIMSGSKEEQGWNGLHYQGIKEACEKFGAKLLVRENILEFTGQCEHAIHELVEEGANMIILSSYGYPQEVIDVIKEYPEVSFYANSSEYHEANLTSYFVRLYQARYLAGIVAGHQSKSGKIGYVAAMSNNEVNRGISAFTLGVRRVNPEAVVTVHWTGSWEDEEKEREAARNLMEKTGVDFITYHQNQPFVIEETEKKKIDSIGFLVDLENISSHYLTSIICNWELVYEEVLRQFLQGQGNSIRNFWIGIIQGAVDLSAFSNAITEEAVKEVEIAKEEIIAGKGVFSGVIYDNQGIQRCGENEIISDEMLLEHFDWYVEGVELYEE